MNIAMRRLVVSVMTGAAALAAPVVASAQTDEIQVYQGGLAAPGVFNLTLHTNFTPNGIKAAAFPGAVVSNRSLNGVPEFAYGVTKWFEAGLYLPLYSVDKEKGFGLDGFKLRALFAEPNADDKKFVYAQSLAGTGSRSICFSIRFLIRRMMVSRISTSRHQPGWPST